MQTQRLFEIVYLLMRSGSLTAKQLAERFEVSTRTILRDIDALSVAGIPVMTTQGKGGGISLMDGYVLNKTLLTAGEQSQILFALQSLAGTGHVDADSTLTKLRAMFARADADWIEVDFSRWGFSRADKAKFELLKAAILDGRQLAFHYYAGNGERSERRVYPLKLVFKSRAWYLQAHCEKSGECRTFKVNRMRELCILAETFERAHFLTYPIERYVPQVPACALTEVRLKLDSSMAYRVFDEFDESSIRETADGCFIVTAQLLDDPSLIDYLLSFAESIEVLSPESIRRRIAKRAKCIESLYAHKT